MKRSSYDRRGAEHLLPLLRSIGREITERSDAVEALEERLLALSGGGQRTRPSNEFLALQSQISNQRRELRMTRHELAKLGCILDEDRPLRVLIPGRDGRFESGHAWDGTSDRLLSNEAAAA